VLAGLQVGRIAQADLEAVRGRSDARLTAPDAAVRRLPGAAEELLAHRPPRGLDELRAELWATTPQHVHAVALEAAGTALLQAPSGHRADWAGYTAAPTTSSYTVQGTRFEAVRKDGTALVVGGEGVSLTAGKEQATVAFRACAALLSWADGGRRLIGTDGLSVEVEPGEYGIDAHTMATIDAAVHPRAVVHLPPRQRQQQHRQPEGAASAGQAGGSGAAQQVQQKASTRRTGGQTAMLVIFGLLAGLWSLLALSYTVFGASDPETSTGEWAGLTVFLWAVGALLAWPAVRVLRGTRRG
jgi:hypothetical protein